MFADAYMPLGDALLWASDTVWIDFSLAMDDIAARCQALVEDKTPDAICLVENETGYPTYSYDLNGISIVMGKQLTGEWFLSCVNLKETSLSSGIRVGSTERELLDRYESGQLLVRDAEDMIAYHLSGAWNIRYPLEILVNKDTHLVESICYNLDV